MTDKPDWEKAWERRWPALAASPTLRNMARGTDTETGFRDGYLTASAHLEAAVAKAKREVLDELQNIAEGLSHDDVVPDLADAYDEAATRLRRKYSEPTAVAATEPTLSPSQRITAQQLRNDLVARGLLDAGKPGPGPAEGSGA